jgi:hypothetical protein
MAVTRNLNEAKVVWRTKPEIERRHIVISDT